MHADELGQLIRFNISQLGAKNGQADFEKICLFFARKRIHPNILPATGPVQAGGDQGRDFETFHSYLKTSAIASSLLIGDFSEKPVAFACSLEKSPTAKKGKIYHDVKTILSSGTIVERIYFFSGDDIPVAKRHKCQENIRAEFNVEVEIIDAQALSQHLADGDLYWVAIQYLKMSSESYPQVTNDWYTEMLSVYKESEHSLNTFEEFTEVKSAVRYIYKNNDLKKDLLFWLPKLDKFIHGEDAVRPLQRKAIYEKYVASLMGLDNVAGLESEIENYYSDFEQYESISELEDAILLLSFNVSAHLLNRHELGIDFLNGIAAKIDSILKRGIDKTQNIDTKAGLLELLAIFKFHDVRSTLSLEIKTEKLSNDLNRVIKLLPKTDYFGIERFADRLNDLLRLGNAGVNTDKIEESARKVDILLAKRGGKDLAAEKLRTRAINFLNNNETLKAINCLHELKLNWFNADSIDSSILSCLLLADAYSKMNLYFASKYYALIAAFLAFKDKKIENYKHFLSGLSMACDADYATGAWLNYIELTDLLILTQFRMTKDFNVYDNNDGDKMLMYPTLIKYCAEHYITGVLPILEARLSKWGYINTDINELLEDKIKKNTTPQSMKESCDNQIDGRIFNDAGEVRKVEFSALGCTWKFHFKNTYKINAVAEQFIAIFQVLLADINQEELYVIPTSVLINVSIADGRELSYDNLHSNEEIIWDIKLPLLHGKTFKEISDLDFQYFIASQVVLYKISLLATEKYQKILKKKLVDENIVNKTTFGRPYFDLFMHFMSEDNFNEQQRLGIENSIYLEGYKPNCNNLLPWKSDDAPAYDKIESNQAIKRRVDNLANAVSVTLPILCKSQGFMNVINAVRNKGWVDWQILHAVVGVVVNHKSQELYKNAQSREELRELAQNLFLKDESEWYTPMPESLFTEERLIQDLTMFLPITVLQSFDLQYDSETPNSKAILELLVKRFHFFEDGKEIELFPMQS